MPRAAQFARSEALQGHRRVVLVNTAVRMEHWEPSWEEFLSPLVMFGVSRLHEFDQSCWAFHVGRRVGGHRR